MKPSVCERLIQLNRRFYEQFSAEFSATRRRLQPGVSRVLDTLHGNESILDLGCGNGELARALLHRGHRGPYLGLDFSRPLLSEAQLAPDTQAPIVTFLQIDLTRLTPDQIPPPLFHPDPTSVSRSAWMVITCFATLHHIPCQTWRFQLLQTIHALLADDGRFLLSNWQFLNSARLRQRIQPWERIGLTADDVEPGDYLLDWRRGGEGLRYVHHFTEQELAALAQAAGFTILDSFYSDGEGGRLSLYQTWTKRR